MSKPAGVYPSLKLDAAGTGIVSQAGATLLVDTAVKIGLDRVTGCWGRRGGWGGP
ncbi:hypothetical protein JOD27_000073 [Lentzea nigeriaca]|nr:hypothetical protein [Lentzea nigeriaca]